MYRPLLVGQNNTKTGRIEVEQRERHGDGRYQQPLPSYEIAIARLRVELSTQIVQIDSRFFRNRTVYLVFVLIRQANPSFFTAYLKRLRQKPGGTQSLPNS